MQRRARLFSLGGVAVGLCIAVGLLLTGAFGHGRSSRAQIIEHCRPGTVPADGPTTSHRACVLIGHPETFQDLSVSNSELGARTTAPFTSSAPGAYQAAVAQRRAMPAADSASGSSWHVAGKPPECAAQTTQSSTCPAPGPDNGSYGYTGTLGFRTLSGRITSLAYDPSTQGRYFASPVAGGVWESRNSGATWRSIGDGLPTQVVGAIAYDAPLHKIIVGTGDNSFGGDGIAGHGIYVSDNGGRTWKLTSGVPDLALSFKIVVSPADSSGRTVYAATSKGLFRSNSGGSSFFNENLPTSQPATYPTAKGTRRTTCASSPTTSRTWSSSRPRRPTGPRELCWLRSAGALVRSPILPPMARPCPAARAMVPQQAACRPRKTASTPPRPAPEVPSSTFLVGLA